MKTIAIIGQKGGTGKSMIAKSLAAGFANDGYSTLGLDLDPQATLSKWYDRRPTNDDGLHVVGTLVGRLAKTVEEAREQGVDICIIDTQGRASQESLEAAKQADFVLVAFKPTYDDLETCDATADLVKMAGKPHATVITMARSVGTENEDAAEALRNHGLTIAPVTFGQRVGFTRASGLGLGAQEYDAGDKSGAEAIALYDYICINIGLKRKAA